MKQEVHLRPYVPSFNIKLPKAAPRKKGELVTALLWGDTHAPYSDPNVLSIFQAIAEDTEPTHLVHMGDGVDCYKLSTYDKDPERLQSQQEEIDMAREHLAAMRKASPRSTMRYLEGNHEDRLRRLLWRLEGPAAVLASLTAFKEAMTWPALLGLKELDCQFVRYNEQTRKIFLPKFLVKHGNLVRKGSAMTARAEHEKYGMSGASGHTHRLGQFMTRDHNGNQIWIETGCGCDLNPDYCQDPDWQNGALSLTFEPETGAFEAVSIYVHKGLAVFNGKVYGKRRRD